MVGQSHRVQIRHIVVNQEEIANMIKEVVDTAKTHPAKIKTLMGLTEKYSLCESKYDGGNLGWLELQSDDPRKVEYEPVFKNHQLESLVRESIKKRDLIKEKVFGPVKTEEGYHIVMIANQFGANFHELY